MSTTRLRVSNLLDILDASKPSVYPITGTDQVLQVGNESDVTDVGYVSYYAPKGWSFMIDQNNQHSRPFSVVTHVKVRQMVPGIYQNPYSGSTVWRLLDPVTKNWCDPDGFHPIGLMSVFPADLNDKLADAADHFKESVTTEIKEQFLLLNDLLELDDLKEIIPKFEHLFQFLRDALLSYSFGVKPTWGDLQLILFHVFQETSERIKFLKKNNGKTITLHRSGSFTPDDLTLPDVIDSTCGGNYVREYVKVMYRPYTFRCNYKFTVKAKLDLSGLDTISGTIDAYAYSLGLTDIVGVIWNAIPYSFVFEWFVNIKDVLSKFKAQPYKGSIDIVEAHQSVKLAIEYTGFQFQDLNNSDPDSCRDTGQRILVTQYDRRGGLPFKEDNSRFSGDLSPMQELLLGALVSQRVRIPLRG